MHRGTRRPPPRSPRTGRPGRQGRPGRPPPVESQKKPGEARRSPAKPGEGGAADHGRTGCAQVCHAPVKGPARLIHSTGSNLGTTCDAPVHCECPQWSGEDEPGVSVRRGRDGAGGRRRRRHAASEWNEGAGACSAGRPAEVVGRPAADLLADGAARSSPPAGPRWDGTGHFAPPGRTHRVRCGCSPTTAAAGTAAPATGSSSPRSRTPAPAPRGRPAGHGGAGPVPLRRRRLRRAAAAAPDQRRRWPT